jgi:hypothetical protein
MKKRYYDIARKLAEARIKDKEAAQKNPVLKTVYDYGTILFHNSTKHNRR